MMERQDVNPWSWQEQLGFSQGKLITGASRVLVCAGQASVDANGAAVHPGDMRAQLAQALDNLETVLQQAGFTLGDVVRLNIYTTDVDRFFEAHPVMVERLAAAGSLPTSTLLGISRLAYPELLVEIEATAIG
jgi:enamine deaminase RidA (YjgF/YER057c/UK114 family)